MKGNNYFRCTIALMYIRRKIQFLLLLLVLVTGCKQKKKTSTLAGEDPVEVADFIDFFQPIKLPYQLYDSVFAKKDKDSLLINPKIFKQFIPDSVLAKVYGKNVKPKLYVLGKAERPKGETYLFVKAVNSNIQSLFVMVFDTKQQFIAGMPVLRRDNNLATMQSVTMDRNFGITKSISMRNADGSISDGKDVYKLDPETKAFLLIMTDALNDKITELINPIDTLQRKNKLSADYTAGKMNLVSIRDGRRNGRLSFFIHFEKNNGACSGELKGEATLRSNNIAEYREDGDPCVLHFIFTANTVTLKEEESCGNRRGLKCAFDGNFARKKYVKPSATKTNAKNK